MSSQDRSGWGLAAIAGVVGALAGGALGWGALYLAAVSGLPERLFGPVPPTLGVLLAILILVPCLGAAAGAIAGTLVGLRISRRARVGGGRRSD
jgi:hypothetical protein